MADVVDVPDADEESEVAESEGDALDESPVELGAEDALALGVAVGVAVAPVGAADVAGAVVLGVVGLLGVVGADEAELEPVAGFDGVAVLGDGVAAGRVAGDVAEACAAVVLGAAGTVSEVSGIALVPSAAGSCVNDGSEANDAIEEIDEFGCVVADDEPDVAAVVPAAAVATVCTRDGSVTFAGAETADAWAGWLVPTAPRVSAVAAAAMPTTPTELSSTPLPGCGLSGNSTVALWKIRGFTRACRAPVLVSRIGLPSHRSIQAQESTING